MKTENRKATRVHRVVVATMVVAVGLPTLVLAQEQSPEQQNCINSLNKTAAKVAAAQGKENAACVKSAGRGRVASGEACLTADEKGKVQKAQEKHTVTQASKCAVAPDFGSVPAATANAAAVDEELNLIHDIFGASLDAAIIDADTDKVGAGCQAAVTKAFEKLAVTVTKEFARCKKSGLKNGSITGPGSLAACVGLDTKDKISKAKLKLTAAVFKKCVGVDSGLAFPGACVGASSFADCVSVTTLCRVCGMLAIIDNALPPCDMADNQVLDGSCSAGSVTTTTTTLPTLECPNRIEFISRSGAGNDCATSADCPEGSTCNGTFCETETVRDLGWSGLDHGADINDGVVLSRSLDCPDTIPGDPQCGVCSVVGIDSSPGNCRCSNDTSIVCDEPLTADTDDCGGATCDCYAGPPIPKLTGGFPTCSVLRFSATPTGTVDLDSGAASFTDLLNQRVYLGNTQQEPCPYCSGDVTANDGIRNGTCVFGANAGGACDVHGDNRTFPVPSGGGHSYDCLPSPGLNVSGLGMPLTLTSTTNTVTLDAEVPCFTFAPGFTCPCGVCSEDSTIGCQSNADCTGTCDAVSISEPQPNGCSSLVCTDDGNGNGECVGDTDMFCDGLLRPNGEGLFPCVTNPDCALVGAGGCTIVQTRKCFLDPITASGNPDPVTPTLAAVGCVGTLPMAALNVAIGLPGAARNVTQGIATSFCGGPEYVPGTGCP